MRRQERPDLQIVTIAFLGFTLQHGEIGQQKLSQGPQQAFCGARRIPFSDNPYHESPLSQIAGAALAPATAFQFGRKDFREVAANAVAY